MSTGWFIIVCTCIVLLVTYVYCKQIGKIIVCPSKIVDMPLSSVINNTADTQKQSETMFEIYQLIYYGAESYFFIEIRCIIILSLIFAIIIFTLLSVTDSLMNGLFTTIAFVYGFCMLFVAKYVAIKIATFTHCRTVVQCQKSLAEGFSIVYKASVIIVLSLVIFTIFNLYILISFFRFYHNDSLFQVIAGYGLGTSFITIFSRIGGEIYKQACDIASDLVGAIEYSLDEDDIRNPAVIADIVGDIVNNAGIVTDLIGSLCTILCATCILSNTSAAIWNNFDYISVPLITLCIEILAFLLSSFIATHLKPPRALNEIEPSFKFQLLISTVISTVLLFIVTLLFLPSKIYFAGYTVSKSQEFVMIKNMYLFLSVTVGLWGGLIIIYATEYYTSNNYRHTQVLAESSSTGASITLIQGVILGYKSVIFPAVVIIATIYISNNIAGFYGVSLSALGMISTSLNSLIITIFTSIASTAADIAEMCGMEESCRARLDALSNHNLKSIVKGVCICSSTFGSFALFCGFITTLQSTDIIELSEISLFNPYIIGGLIFGAAIPYWISYMIMEKIGKITFDIVSHVRQQFNVAPEILTGQAKPDYAHCIRIATEGSLKYMTTTVLLIMVVPIVAGFVFGCKVLASILIGVLISGLYNALFAANTSIALSSAKQYLECGKLMNHNREYLGKGSDAHKALIIGNTFGEFLGLKGGVITVATRFMIIESLLFVKAFFWISGINNDNQQEINASACDALTNQTNSC
eukprot:479192_1